MRINIIGAGPAGLYSAIYLGQNGPYDVHIFEKNNPENRPGFGYTINGFVVKYLSGIDDRIEVNLEPRLGSSMTILRTILNDDLLTEGRLNYPLLGIQRSSLIDYLTNLAKDCGVKIHYGTSLDSRDVDRFRSDCDVLIGADGIRSVVRQRFSSEFGANSYEGKNRYIWLLDNMESDRMVIRIREYDGHIIFSHSYPIGNVDSVIVECTQEGFNHFGLNRDVHPDGTITERGVKKLEDILSNQFSGMDLQSIQSRWTNHRVNSCQRFSFENVALAGEAAVSRHYQTGGGLLIAFFVAQKLAKILTCFSNPTEALVNYTESLDIDNSSSLQYIRWSETIDQRRKVLDDRRFLNEFFSTGRK